MTNIKTGEGSKEEWAVGRRGGELQKGEIKETL